jgi:vanillate O-demethylase monooxygenase subunit
VGFVNELDHWHPVLKTGELGAKPVKVTVAGRALAVFRSGSRETRVAALGDRCPHRGASLSLGQVKDGSLVCPYHAWRFAPDGQGASPGNPRLRPCAESFDAVERLGAVWVRRAGAATAFPRFEVEGWFPVGRYRHLVDAPLELALDNFTEVEHTGHVHLLLGYPTERMAEVESQTTILDDRVRVFNVGPQRPMPRVLHALFEVPTDAWFVDDWTTYFSPVHTVYDQYWVDARTRQRVSDALRIAVFFNPVTPESTELFTLAYSSAAPWSRLGISALLYPVTHAFVDIEVRRDARLLASLADKRTSIDDARLGRFDKGLLAARRRIDRIYRGSPPSRVADAE